MGTYWGVRIRAPLGGSGMGATLSARSDGRWKRFAASVAVAALAVTGLVVVDASAPAAMADSAGPAPIEQRNAQTVTADGLPTVQIDGVVWAQVITGNTVFAGGSFANARPAGAAPGTSLMPRSNILAYDITTGVATSFAPVINGPVKSLALSPDGSRLYVGGAFSSVNGLRRYNVAAFDVATGALLNFAPTIGGSFVNAIVATATTVYYGGLIGAAGGASRKNLAATNISGTAVAWAPTADLQVDTMVLTPAKDKLIIGGRFGKVNGVDQRGLAALSLADASMLPWDAPATVQNGRSSGSGAGKAGIWALTADSGAVYGTGWVFADTSVGNLEGTFAAEGSSGAIRWVADCHGDHYGIYSDGTNVYSTSHEHECTTAGGLPQGNGTMRNATAYTAAAKGTLTRSPYVNAIYADWSGYPAPAAVNWFPDWLTGTASGLGQAGFSMTGNGTYLVVGGEFIGVNNQGQQGLVRFSNRPSTGAKQGPRVSGAAWQPAATSVASGTVRVVIPSNWDRDDRDLTYSLMEGTNVVATQKGSSTFWNTPGLRFSVKGLAPGSAHTYRVVATDGDGNSATSATTTVTVTDAAPSAYANAVLDDGATLFWRLGGDSGGVDLAGANNAVFGEGITAAADDALIGENTGSISANGSGSAGSSVVSPVGATFAAEVWFRTTTTTGGKILGYGSQQAGSSGSYDRHVYMTNDGRLVFGTYPGYTATATSSAAYNDGSWHHVVAQQGAGGMQLFVDGKSVATSSATTAQAYDGYWRLGGDNLGGWPSGPQTSNFAGDLDEFAVYSGPLSSERIAAHFLIGHGPLAKPVAVIGVQSAGLRAVFDSTKSTVDKATSVAAYKWDFGDGGTSTEANPVHAFASEGTYAVALTITDAEGASSTTNQQVTIGGAATPTAAYRSRVIADGASLFWPLGIQSTTADLIGTNPAALRGALSATAEDPFAGASGSVSLDGTSAYASSTSRASAAVPVSAEIWFKTTTQRGGKIFGYGGSDGQDSSNYDRHLYMSDDGHLVFGVWRGYAAIATSTEAYNDGEWHHAVGEIGPAGTRLFVDGELVGSDPGAVSLDDYDGFWRVGRDNLGGWPGQPSSYAFEGQIADFAVYNSELSATAVDEHYSLGTGGAVVTADIAVTGSGFDRAFDASGSIGSNGQRITSYSWSFGDGQTRESAGPATFHMYGAPGVYTVTLTVADEAGRTALATKVVTIGTPHTAPIAHAEASISGLTVSFDPTSTTVAPGSTITDYSWSFGDGATSTEQSPRHRYASAQSYTATLTVTDSQGVRSEPFTFEVVATHADPSADFAHEESGLTVTVDATASTAADDATLTYDWQWGDSSAAGSGASATHRYNRAGSYPVTLTITDSLGRSSSKTVTITASHADPVASFTSTANRLSVSVDASASTASDDADLTYAWNWGDHSPDGSGVSSSHDYAAAGTYQVALTVTDSAGGSKTTSKDVTVSSTVTAVSDDFGRTVTAGWGTAATGDTWSSVAGASVSGGVGKLVLGAGSTRSPYLSSVVSGDLDTTATVSLDKVAAGTVFVNLVAHRSAAGDYRLKFRSVANGTITVYLVKVVGGSESQLATKVLSGYTYAAGDVLRLHLKSGAVGSSTKLSANVWPKSQVEPSGWMVTSTDSTPALQAPGQVGFLAYASSNVANAPVTVSFDDLVVTNTQTVPHQAPTAGIEQSAKSLTASFSAGTSQAFDGASIVGYSWSFGDGRTSTTASPSNSYAAAGTYTVTLTVTDSAGAVSTAATSQVTVAHDAPLAGFGTNVSALSVTADASASTASDGASMTYTWDWGDSTDPSEGVAPTHQYTDAGDYVVTLTVGDSMGGSSAVSKTITVSTESVVPPVASDQFERTVASGWGSADVGGAWTTGAGFSVAAGEGKISFAGAAQTRTATLPTVAASNVDLAFDFAPSGTPDGGGLQLNAASHRSSSGEYRAKVWLRANGSVVVYLAKVVGGTETALSTKALAGVAYTAGTRLNVRFSTSSAGGATALSAKVWPTGVAEPADPTLATTDGTPELQSAGSVGFTGYLSGSTTNAPITVGIDNLQVR